MDQDGPSVVVGGDPPHPIPRSKKIGELLGAQLAEATGVEIINLRISGTWGPAGHEDPYNVASGRLTPNADIIDAVRAVEPGFDVELLAGESRPGNPLDITRLHEDTGYQPEYDTASASDDYIAWLRVAVHAARAHATGDLIPHGEAPGSVVLALLHRTGAAEHSG